jgi:hypothetical protein
MFTCVFVVLVWWQENSLEVDIDTNLNYFPLLEAKSCIYELYYFQ